MARFCDSNQKRGVTLVELIVVLVILAVLAALLVPSLTGYIDKAVEKRIMLQARSLMTAAQATIDEAYAKGELHIDDNGGFEPLNVDTAHKLAKQIIEFADLASNNGEPVYFRLQEDHVGKYRDRLSGLRVRTGSFLFPERAFRCVYHLVFGGPLFGLESNKTVVTALIKE